MATKNKQQRITVEKLEFTVIRKVDDLEKSLKISRVTFSSLQKQVLYLSFLHFNFTLSKSWFQ